MRRLWPVLLLALAPLLAGARWGVPIELPAPIGLPEFTDTVKISHALLGALTRKRWIVESDTGDAITATLKVRAHRLRLRIDYSSQKVSFHYVDSENLSEEKTDTGGVLIHPNANKWLHQLEDEVRLQLQQLRFERDAMEVVPAL